LPESQDTKLVERVTLGTVKLEVGIDGVKKCASGKNEAKDGRSQAKDGRSLAMPSRSHHRLSRVKQQLG
jgi:hypothetical protein